MLIWIGLKSLFISFLIKFTKNLLIKLLLCLDFSFKFNFINSGIKINVLPSNFEIAEELFVNLIISLFENQLIFNN